MRLHCLLAMALCLSITTVADAQYGNRKLEVGDAAPGLDIATWVKGDETAIESDKVYVVEFWATWCGPCRKSIPHLTELQSEYADDGLVIIGVSDEETDVVERFVRSQGDKMDYTVAVDKRASTKRAWHKAAGLKGIPAAFVVDRGGKVAFIGHPLSDEFEEAVRKVLKGRYDPALEKQVAPMISAARSARKVRNWRMALKHYDEAVEASPRVFATTALERFEMVLVDMNESKQAYDYAQNTLAAKHFADDADALEMLARMIATDPDIPTDSRNLPVALAIAESALDVAGRHNPDALATLALVHYEMGDLDNAVKLQQKAYFRAGVKHKPQFKRVLTSYQQSAGRALSSR